MESEIISMAVDLDESPQLRHRRRQHWESPINENDVLSFTPPKTKTSYLIQDRRNSRLMKKEEQDEEEYTFFEEDLPKDPNKEKAINAFELVTSVIILAALLFTLKIQKLRSKKIWILLIWQWEVSVLILVFGRVVSRLIFGITVLFMKRSFLLRKRFLYFLLELKMAVHYSLWFGLILIVWYILYLGNVMEDTQSVALSYMSRVLVCLLLGLILWLGKTLLVKALMSHFYMALYFDKVLDSLFYQYVIAVLSSPQNDSQRPFRLCSKIGDEEDPEINIDLLHKLTPKNVSNWIMKRMVDIIEHCALFTVDDQMEESINRDESIKDKGEKRAKIAAGSIFKKVAKPRCEYISLEDIEQFMQKDEAVKTMSVIGGPISDRISESALERWVVKAYRDRKALCSTLNDMSSIIKKLHMPINLFVGIIIQLLLFFILRIASKEFFKSLAFIGTQIFLWAIMFGSTLKAIFEAVIFLFVIHPFDVGDVCYIDNALMKVEKINIFNTIFRRNDDNMETTTTNKVLATKTIANLNRTHDLIERLEFCVHIRTQKQQISTMEQRISSYINNNKEHYWYPEPMIICKGIEELERLKFQVLVKHTLNDLDMDERDRRKATLMAEIHNILREMKINETG